MTRNILTIAALLTGAGCFAQTGILDPDAIYRGIPEQAGEIMKENPAFRTLTTYPATPVSDGNGRRTYHPVDSDSLSISPALDSLNRHLTERPVPGSRRRADEPLLFLIGDSTMRTEIDGNGFNGQWGWGYYLPNYFDTGRISIENHGLGGESTRSYYKNWLFPILQAIRPGDWVIIQLGHNDRTGGAEMTDGRFRGILPGTGREYVEVILPGSGTRERVYTYGEYLRIYIDEIRLRGGQPILLSTTSRKRFTEDGKTMPDSKAAHVKAVAEQKGVPFIDFNAAIVDKYNNVFDRRKVEYLYFSDGIHSSSFGAVINAETFVEELRKRADIGLSAYLLPEKKRESGVRKEDKPVTFIVGDAAERIDRHVRKRSAAVDNHAKAGCSARTFLDEGRWNVVYGQLRPGDYVLIQFGRNDAGPINTGAALGALKGNGNEKQVMTMEASGVNQGIYSFGWYIRKYCLDAMEKGAVPIVVGSGDDNYRKWSREAAEQCGARFIDASELGHIKL